MKVLFMKSQKKGKRKTCLHFTFQLALPSYPLTWYHDENISVPPRPWVWPGEAESLGGGPDLTGSEALSSLMQAFPLHTYIQGQC